MSSDELVLSEYNRYFDDESKIKAFDQIAKNFFVHNFGSMSKSDIELLLFSLLIDRILDNSESDPNTYSDYTLSKLLGITEQRINNLKIKKELKYPYEKFDWRESFARIIKNARYEEEKIKVYIPDPNLYIELKNVIESNGGYIEITLNRNLLQISPEYYFLLVREVCNDEEKAQLDKAINEQLKKREINIEDFQPMSVKKFVRKHGMTVFAKVLASSAPGVGGVIGNLLLAIFEEKDK